MSGSGKTSRHGGRGHHDRGDAFAGNPKTSRLDQVTEHHLGAEPLKGLPRRSRHEPDTGPAVLGDAGSAPPDGPAVQCLRRREAWPTAFPAVLRPRATRMTSIGVPGLAGQSRSSAPRPLDGATGCRTTLERHGRRSREAGTHRESQDDPHREPDRRLDVPDPRRADVQRQQGRHGPDDHDARATDGHTTLHVCALPRHRGRSYVVWGTGSGSRQRPGLVPQPARRGGRRRADQGQAVPGRAPRAARRGA